MMYRLISTILVYFIINVMQVNNVKKSKFNGQKWYIRLNWTCKHIHCSWKEIYIFSKGFAVNKQKSFEGIQDNTDLALAYKVVVCTRGDMIQ